MPLTARDNHRIPSYYFSVINLYTLIISFRLRYLRIYLSFFPQSFYISHASMRVLMMLLIETCKPNTNWLPLIAFAIYCNKSRTPFPQLQKDGKLRKSGVISKAEVPQGSRKYVHGSQPWTTTENHLGNFQNFKCRLHSRPSKSDFSGNGHGFQYY